MSVRYSFSSTRISETPLPHYVKFKKITSFKQKEKKKEKRTGMSEPLCKTVTNG